MIAHSEKRYQNILRKTVGIVFLGTPHGGSRSGDYDRVLQSVAMAVLGRSTPFFNALKENKDYFLQLTSDFVHQSPTYQIVSVYELMPSNPCVDLVSPT